MALTWDDDKSSCAEVAVSPSNTWNIFHIPVKGTNCRSVGGTCKAPLLATVASPEPLSCSNCCVDGLLTQSPRPPCPSLACFPLGCEMGKRWSVTLWGQRGRDAVGLPCSSLQLVHGCVSVGPDSCALPACLPCTAGNRISPRGKSILGRLSNFSVRHQKVGFEHKMGFI